MRSSLCVLVLFSSMVGCTHTSLQRAAIRQTSTINDLYFQQIVQNLADFHLQPSGLPQFSVVTDGTSQLADSGTATNAISWVPKGFSTNTLTLQANRQLMGNWKVSPTIALAGRLRRMRCAFQIVTTDYPTGFARSEDGLTLTPLENDAGYGILCMREMQDFGLLPKPVAGKAGVDRVDTATQAATFHTVAAAKDFITSFEVALNRNLPRCWYHVGGCKDVPKCACYRAERCETAVWVDEDGIDALSRFTLSIVSIATTEPPSAAVTMVLVKRKFSLEDEEWEVSATVPEKQVNDEIARLAKATAEARQALAAEEQELDSLLDTAVVEFNAAPAEERKAFTDKLPGPLKLQLKSDNTITKDGLKSLANIAERANADHLEIVSNVSLKSVKKAQDDVTKAKSELNKAKSDFANIQILNEPNGVSTPFDRPATLPLSRSTPGIEFVPSAPNP